MYKDPVIGSKERANVGWFLIELVVYAIFVVGYYFLVLHFLGHWLKQVFDQHKLEYAVVALALIAAQGVLLELITDGLFKFIRGKKK